MIEQFYNLGPRSQLFKPNGIFHYYQLDQSIFSFKGCSVAFSFYFFSNFFYTMEILGLHPCICPTTRTPGLYRLRYMNILASRYIVVANN